MIRPRRSVGRLIIRTSLANSSERFTRPSRSWQMRRIATLVAAGIVGLGLSTSVWAQSTATIQGSVTDAQGGVMPGVTLTITSQATNAERATTTDAVGQYAAPALPPGRYTIVARIEGFQDQTREVDLGVAQTLAINFRLSISAVAESLTVTGAAPLVDTARVSVGQ